jgi:hypothetical protein
MGMGSTIQKGKPVTTHYKGERIADLLQIIDEMEQRLTLVTTNADPLSLAKYEEVAHGYSSLAIAKAKLKALQGEK